MKKSFRFPRRRRLSRALCVIALFSILLSSGLVRADDAAFPPEPQQPKTTKSTTREESRALWDKWRAEHGAWEQNLTVEQRAAWKKARDEERRKSQEEYRKRGELPAPEDGYDWKQDAAKRKLDDATTGLLEKQKIAFGPSVKQVFSPYMGGGPVFVTSDSLLNAFHVLFEDSFREIELRRAYALQGQLETLLQGARKFRDAENGKFFPEARHAAALRHAQLVLGPAIVALGGVGALDQFDAELRPEISAQAEKIQSAQAVELPAWLAPANGGDADGSLLALDYRRCKPAGFYADRDNEKLAAYFRATRWLQMVPFRASRLAEFDAILLLGFVQKDAKLEQAFLQSARFVGPPDDPAPSVLMKILDTTHPRGGRGRPSEFERFDCALPETKTKVANALLDAGYYQINSDLRWKKTLVDVFADSSFRLMPASRLQDAVLFQQLMDRQIAPRGLAVAAMLGSPFAAGQLTEAERAEVAAFNASPQNKRTSAGDYWEGSGLQLYEKYLHALEALFAPPPAEAPEFVKGKFWEAKNCQTSLASWAQMRHTFTLQAKVSEYYFGMMTTPPGFVEPNPEFFARMARVLDAVVARLGADDFFIPSGARAAEAQFRQRWDSLRTIAHTLEAMAHKQLRRQPWSEDESKFLKNYGEKLGNIMGYFGNSWEAPRDDAPRWVEVARDPRPNRDTALAVAVGRPRYLYVLYPWNGMEILCQGAVMQYYEYDAGLTPLTDAEWLSLLDSPDAPPIPAWQRPFAAAPEKPRERR